PALAAGLDELEQAALLVHRVLPPTPQYAWPKLRRRIGCTVWVKHENHTPTGAFKVRGGLVYFDRLVRRLPGISGVISATRGNHGQSIAFAAARAGLAASIYVPVGNSPDQNTAMQAFGATVVEFGHDFEEARCEAERVAAAQGLHLVPSFHQDLVVGVATYALELFRAAPPLDAVYVPIGMGSGICGLIAARDLLGLHTEIIGVSAANAPASARSFAAGHAVATPSARTFADGIATRAPDRIAIAAICRGAARVVTVSEDEIAEAMRVYYDDTHQVAEGAAAAALAALLQERASHAGRTIGVILSGGNIERARFLQVLGGATPQA
ncbi:MAG TPA: threonine dehydratase, partial [Steroidobacteraceae bacterium]|nr:threonine dehydratase [Steroidobacteraceae bacterium]